MTREEAIAKAVKLLNLAKSDNVHEATLAAQRAQEILLRFDISMAMLDEQGTEPQEDVEDFSAKGAPLDKGERKLARWKTYLAGVIAKANQCQTYLRGPSIALVGRASNADTVRYMYAALGREVEQLAKKAGKGCGRTWANNYRLGVVDAIRIKLEEMNKKVIEEVRNEANANGMGLVKVDTALATIDRRNKDVTDWMKKNLKLHKIHTKVNHDAVARGQGQKDGANININRGRASLGAGLKGIAQ